MNKYKIFVREITKKKKQNKFTTNFDFLGDWVYGDIVCR